MVEPTPAFEDAEEARFAALFAEAPRPPLGDDRFVQAVAAGVDRIEERRRRRLSWALAGGVLASLVGGVAFGGDVIGAAADAYAPYLALAPQVGSGAALVALLAAAAGYALAER